jgi:hypothetical protein
MQDMDRLFLIGGMEWNFGPLVSLISQLPIASIQHFLGARERVRQVCDLQGQIRDL